MSDSYKMNSHKLMWHLDRLTPWMEDKKIVPLYIDMGITQTCNISCTYCFYATPENRTKKIISTDNMKIFLKECAEMGVKAIGILGDGEPMVHKGVYDIINSGKEYGLDMAISTNGKTLNSEKAKQFLSSLSWIRFNISAAKKSTYAKVMGTSEDTYDTVIKNIKLCVALKQKYNLDVTIGMQMVLVPDCLDDIVDFAKLGKQIGVDYAVIKQCSENLNQNLALTLKDFADHKDKLLEAEQFTDENFSMIVKWEKIQKFGVRNYEQCYGCEFLPQISGAGDVYPCGSLFLNPEYYIGNINTHSFKDIVHGERYHEVMKKVTSDVDVHKDCGTSCRQNEINEFLFELKNKPQHLNFI
jgi:radical SAM protein with 4Fe4S-binding SPASM domain